MNFAGTSSNGRNVGSIVAKGWGSDVMPWRALYVNMVAKDDEQTYCQEFRALYPLPTLPAVNINSDCRSRKCNTADVHIHVHILRTCVLESWSQTWHLHCMLLSSATPCETLDRTSYRPVHVKTPRYIPLRMSTTRYVFSIQTVKF